jgi:hypothetical protein
MPAAAAPYRASGLVLWPEANVPNGRRSQRGRLPSLKTGFVTLWTLQPHTTAISPVRSAGTVSFRFGGTVKWNKVWPEVDMSWLAHRRQARSGVAYGAWSILDKQHGILHNSSQREEVDYSADRPVYMRNGGALVSRRHRPFQ